VDVDGGDPEALVQQVDREVEGGRGFARPALLVAHDNDMRPGAVHRSSLNRQPTEGGSRRPGGAVPQATLCATAPLFKRENGTGCGDPRVSLPPVVACAAA